MNWLVYGNAETIGKLGSEKGTILLDEHCEDMRITLEEGCTHGCYAITCGMSGWFVHTVFISRHPEAVMAYKRIKEELESLSVVNEMDRIEEIGNFINRW